MFDSILIEDDLEKTQRLSVSTRDTQLEEGLKREQAARIEIVDLMRQNVRQAREIDELQRYRDTPFLRFSHQRTHAIDRFLTTEQALFEVCGALKNSLMTMLSECQTQNLALKSSVTAARTLTDCCDRLEGILSDPGFSAPNDAVIGVANANS